MPIYLYRCANGHRFQLICPVSDHEEAVSCQECNLVAQQVITAPMMVKVRPSICYDSPIDGRIIESWAQREEDLKRHGCQAYDPGMRTDFDRRRQESQAQLEQAVEQTICEEIAKMPTAKKAKLYSEMTEQGAGCNVVRSTPFA